MGLLRRTGGHKRREITPAKSLMGRWALPNLEVLLLMAVLVVSFGIGAVVEVAWGNEAPIEPADTVVISVSGTQGLPFVGSYGTLSGGGRTVDDAVLGLRPVEYEVPVGGGAGFASFRKQAAAGDLEVRILVNGEVVKEGETSEEYGVVEMPYSSLL